jgi:Flp pilus assembly protein TadG
MSRPARRGRGRGQSLVEFALILPILALLLFILFDFGRAVYAWTAVSNAAREGARLAIVDQGETAGISHAAQAAADQATGLGIDPADASEVAVQYRSADLAAACPARAIGCVAQVRVQYEFLAITPVIGTIVGPITLSSTTQIPIESTNPR